jgi:poly(ADP-ribose) glycohydrolase ARH3
MIGTAMGDAIGELAFTHRTAPDLRTKVARAETLVYTDDTAMAIGLAESIVQMGGIDQQHLGDTFRANFEREPWRGYAAGPPTLFALVERSGIAYAEAAQSLFGGQGSFGNGAAMRIAPVGLLYHTSSDLYEQVHASATVTHAHPVGVDGAAVLAKAIAQAMTLDPREPFPLEDLSQELASFTRTEEIRNKMALVNELLVEKVSPIVAGMALGPSVAAHESVPFAIYAFLRYCKSFEDCLFCAALNSGDRDTVGAMACAISGAYLGVEAIPQELREKVENREHIEGLAVRLAEMTSQT